MTDRADRIVEGDDDKLIGGPETEPPPDDPELDQDVKNDEVPTHPDDPPATEDDASVGHDAPEA